MKSIRGLAGRFATRFKPHGNKQAARSQEARPAYNAAIAGRRWNGQLFQPTPHANASAWGFGFVPPAGGVDSLGVPLGRHCFGQKIRIRMWRCESLRPTDLFRAPGAKGDRLILDRVFEAVAFVQGEPIAQFCRVDVSEITLWEQCLHLVELRFAEIPMSPLAIGRSIRDGPWKWECGWVHLKGRRPVPLERPWGVAWAAYGKDEGTRRGCVRHGVEVAGTAQVQGFTLSLPSIAVSQTSQTIVSAPVEFQIPAPRFYDGSAVVPDGRSRILLPHRHVEVLEPRSGSVRQLQSEIRRSDDSSGDLHLNYRGWASRYDLVSVHPDSGQLALVLGEERDMDPEEYPAQLPQQHLPLYSLYTTKDGVEAIPVWEWKDMVRKDRRADHIWWLESSRKYLARTFRKLRRGGTFRLVGYGDSLTSLGGRDPQMVDSANGPFRDTLGYFERYGEDWKSSVKLFSNETGGERRHHHLGWNWYLKTAMESAFDVTVEYLNWGLPGTTTEANHKRINACSYPNGSEPGRLKRMLDSSPDLVTVCFGMNDIGDPVDTYGNMRRICEAVQAAGADVIVVGLCQQNAGFDSRDHCLWRLTHDQIAAAAHDCGVTYVPTWEIFGDGNEGATGLSRWSHSAASMTNHPGARELGLIGRYMAKIIV